jgi:hypothetical protein
MYRHRAVTDPFQYFYSLLCRTTHFDRADAETGVIGQ